MRICLMASHSIRRDPRAVAQAGSIRSAGHEVVAVSADPADFDWVTRTEPSLTDRLRRSGVAERLVRAARRLEADLYIPTRPAAVDLARSAARGKASFLTEPAWNGELDEQSLIWLTPGDPSRSLPSSGESPTLHVPSPPASVPHPATGRVLIVYRKTERNPGRYLEAALRRLGVETLHSEAIDWDLVSPDTTGVVVVESPLPALPVTGSNPGIPVVFWVHHGEHHLDANVRLQRHYGAHAVALAHSWHLAYRFEGLVERLPFGVAPELGGQEFVGHDTRRYDVAFVGSAEGGARYRRRSQALEAISAALGRDRVALASDINPAEMASLYRDSRIVPDDGAGRHLPITMRVFEAAGAGALLVTREAPGLDLLFQREAEFVAMSGNGSHQVVELAAGATEPFGRAAHATAWRRHTYDRRVEELMSIFARVRDLGLVAPNRAAAPSGLAGGVAGFCDAQRILTLGADLGGQLPDRELWDFGSVADRAEPHTFQISVIAGGTPEERRRAIAAARTAVVTEPGLASEVEGLVAEIQGDHQTLSLAGKPVFTFGGFGYRVTSGPDLPPDG